MQGLRENTAGFGGGRVTFGSLFAGIGGLDLGLERAGMECRWQVERDKYASRVLAKHWPAVARYDDVCTMFLFDPEGWRFVNAAEPVELLCGGFPCQDISHAGKGVGIFGERSGLWSEFARLVAEIRPRFVFAENVPALRNRGLALVLQDLWALGYDAEWHCIPACAFGAPHERDRIWIVAHAAGVFGKAFIGGEPDGALSIDGLDADASGERYEGVSDAEQRAAGAGLHGQNADAHEFDGDNRRHGAGAVFWVRPETPNISGSEANADTDRFGLNRRSAGEKQPREAQGRESAGCFSADADIDGPRREEQRSCEPDGAEQPPAECGNWWATEPGVVRALYGFSAWMDGSGLITQSHNRIMDYGNATEARTEEVLRFLRDTTGEEIIQRSPGGLERISPSEVLLTYLWKLSERSDQSEHFQFSGEEAFEAALRVLWVGQESSGSSRGPEPGAQHGTERTDALQALSRLLAHDAEKAWSGYRRENAQPLLAGWGEGWEDGFRRMAHGIPNRVDRLRGLGNAVVPQVSEWLGRRIIAAHERAA